MSTLFENAARSVACLSSLLVRGPSKTPSSAKRRTKRQNDLRRASPLPWRRNILGIAVAEKATNHENIEGQFCLKFFVREKLSRSRIRPAEIIPEVMALDSIEAEVLTDVDWFPGIPVAQSSERVRPLRPGAAVGHYLGTKGTLGLIVKQRGAAEPLLLSCSHVLALAGEVDPQDVHENAIEQPADFDAEVGSNRVGKLSQTFSRIIAGSMNRVDAALAEIDEGQEVSIAIPEIGKPAGISQLLKNDLSRVSGIPVIRYGAATELQSGVLQSVEAVFPIRYPVLGDRVAFLQRMALYKTLCAPGDSGSAVLDPQTREVMGLHVAGVGQFGLFTPIQIVLNALDAELF